MAVSTELKQFGKADVIRVTMGDGDTKIVYAPDSTKGSISVNVTAPGTGKVETSASHPDNIEAGTGLWAEWPLGIVSVDTDAQPFCSRVNAIRLTGAGGGGAVSFEILLEKE